MNAFENADLAPLYPDRSLPIPVAHQFENNLRTAITSGAFADGTRLLPSREFAARIGVSRNTIVAAIDQLIAEGYLVARVGSGTFVAPRPRERNATASRQGLALPTSAIRFRDAIVPKDPPCEGMSLFRHGIPDLDAFPTTIWDRLSRRYDHSEYGLGYGPDEGVRELREALATHLRQFRGVVARPEDVIITAGAQSALMLIADVMIAPGDPVVFEDPCYGTGRAAFVSRGAKSIPIRVDDSGLDVAMAPAARLACVTPAHQYPLGGVMSEDRRAALIAWARSSDAYVVEDDYDGEFAFPQTPLRALQGDDSRRVLYVGTFSKVLAPGLRLGYLVCPPHLTAAFRAARAITSLGAPTATQSTMAAFIAEGHFARHVRRLNTMYRHRADRLNELLRPLSDLFSVGPITGGMHISITSRRRFDDVEVAREGRASGIALHPLSVECVKRTDLTGFLLGFGTSPVESLPAGVAAVAQIMRADRSKNKETIRYDSANQPPRSTITRRFSAI